MTKLFPSTCVDRTPRTYRTRESDGEDVPNVADMDYRSLRKLAGDIDGIDGRSKEAELREALKEHYDIA